MHRQLFSGQGGKNTKKRIKLFKENTNLTFGPVPSRRLGQSLGINNIPPKVCTYSCVYCQLGRTPTLRSERNQFYDPQNLADEALRKIEKLTNNGEKIDYLTFVPDGEPTLDIHLGKEIELLRGTGIKIAVITNSSLIWREDVRQDLLKADWVSLKVDSVEEQTWRTINRPYRPLSLPDILNGIREFSAFFRGTLTTETMLVQGINDSENQLQNTARFLQEIQPATAYLAVPTRPPAEKYVTLPSPAVLTAAYHIFIKKLARVELLTGDEGNSFTPSGNPEEDLLAITSVHPMREDAVATLLNRTKSDWTLVDRLVREEKLIKSVYHNRTFYLRNFLTKN